MTGQRGFTLVEVLATGVIASVLAGSILTIMKLTSTQISQETERSRSARIFDIASEEIHRVARRARTVLGDSETDSDDALSPSYRKVRFYTGPVPGGTLLGGFNIRTVSGVGGVLEEWKSGAFQTFKVGADSIVITNSGNFIIASATRSAFSFQFHVRINSVPPDTLANIREMVFCRNINL